VDTILTLLKEDHEKVADILEKLESITEKAVKKRGTLFSTLKNELSQHKKFEEEVFYPAIKEKVSKVAEAKNLVMEAYQEHHVVDVLIAEMEELDCSDEVWTAKLRVLKKNIEHHVEEEEGDLFPKVKKILTAKQLGEMGLQLKEWKKGALSRNSQPV
jgi:iron-sulfur cluster repair protein YtfE (RIC family)